MPSPKLLENTQITVRLRLKFYIYGNHSDEKTDQQWPELLGILFHLSQSADPGQRENAYRIFTTTPGIIEKQHEDTVLSAFTKGFKDDTVDVSCIPKIHELPSNRLICRCDWLPWKPLLHFSDRSPKRTK